MLGPEVTFRQLLSSIMDREECRQRVVTVNKCPIYLRLLENYDEGLIGELVRHRVNEPAMKGNLDGVQEPVALEEDEALLGPTVFLYNPRANIVALERVRSGVSQSAFCQYMAKASAYEGALGLNLVIDPAVLEKIASMETYRALEVKLATFRDPEQIAHLAPDVRGALELARTFDAPYVDFTVTMGAKKGSLGRRHMLQTIKDLFKLKDNETLKKARVTGVEDRETEAIDLIQHRIYHEEELQVSNQPDVWYKTRRDLLRRAWNEHRTTVTRYARRME